MYGQTGIAMALFFTEADVFFSGMMHMHYLYITEIIVLFSCEFLYINFVRYQRSVVGNAKNKDQEPDR
jgi:hypothetical protein